MENLDFVATTNGLEVSFRVLSKVPAKAIFDWDFGDDKGSAYDVKQPTYTYEKSGFYTVALNITNSDGLNLSATKLVIVNTEAVTTLTDSIYNLINYFIPSEISDGMTIEEKEMYITKWQLYIQPLVNHCIPLDKYNDELMYEALENQLIMELAAWDYLNVKLLNLLTSTGEYLSQLTSTKEQEGMVVRNQNLPEVIGLNKSLLGLLKYSTMICFQIQHLHYGKHSHKLCNLEVS